LNDKEFDQYIKARIQEEERQDTKPVPDEVLEMAIRKAISDAPRKRRPSGLLLSAAILVLSLTAGSYVLFQKEEAPLVADESAVMKQPVPKVDVAKTKAKLAAEGFAIKKDGIPADQSTGGALMDIAFNFSLKDYVFNSETIVKGKVLGTRSFIEDRMAYSEVKLLVEEVISGPASKGDILTYVSAGGVISRYDFLKMEGMDEKFNMKESELESSKREMVAASFMDKVIYPDDELYVFAGKDTRTVPFTGKQAISMGFRINITGGEISNLDDIHFELADTTAYKELEEIGSLTELANTLEKLAEEKSGNSKEKALEAAYDVLSSEEQREVGNMKSAIVLYHSESLPIKDGKSDPNMIEVSFSAAKPISVYLKASDLSLYVKKKTVHAVGYTYTTLKSELKNGGEFEFAYGDWIWGVYQRKEGWVLLKGIQQYSGYFPDLPTLLEKVRIDGETMESVLNSANAEILTIYEN
jgi:hypothetical protein